jgi:predicted kinase
LAEPLLIVVTGMPAAGKTTIARALAAELKLPLVTKDDLKERLFDELGTGDSDWSRRVGGAAYALLFDWCREFLAAGCAVMVEANFFAGSQEEQFRALPPHRLVQVHCRAPLELLATRYGNRDARHPGHLDHKRVDELHERFTSGAHAALALDGELIEVGTSRGVDVGRLADDVRARS